MFGFLSAIPQFLGSAAGAVGHGLGKVGSTVAKAPKGIFGKLGHLGEGGADEMALTPGFNPEASMPNIRAPQQPGNLSGVRDLLQMPGEEEQGIGARLSAPRMDRPSPLALPLPIPGGGAPVGGSLPAPTVASPIEDPILAARSEYNSQYKPPTGIGDRLKRGILPALGGALRGYGQTGNAAGAMAGAAGGFGAQVAAPRQAYEGGFDQRIKPQILERQKREQEKTIFDEARRKAQLEDQYKQAQIGQMGSENQRRTDQSQFERDKFDFERGKPITVAPGAGLIRPGEDQPYYTAPNRPQAAPLPYSAAEGGVLDRRTGMVTPNEYAKDRSAPKETKPNTALINSMRSSIKDFEKLKTTANTETDQALRAQALFQMKAKAQEISDLYGDQVEVGGDGNAVYVKPRVQSQPKAQAARPKQGGGKTAVSMDAVRAFALEKGISEQDALKKFQTKGIEVR